MIVYPVSKYPQNTLDSLLAALPFYKAVKQKDPWQYDLLMSHSRIIEYRPNEVILTKGQKDQWLYFLLKGQLMVLVGDDTDSPQVVNHITPGEVFGDLAVLNDFQRTATVKADPNVKAVVVFGTDFEVFGELTDLYKITLPTKLEYYRNMTHNLRWKLEVYRLTYPEKPNAVKHRKVKLYTGPKDTLEELIALHQQSKELADLLVSWNADFEGISTQQAPALDYSELSKLD